MGFSRKLIEQKSAHYHQKIEILRRKLHKGDEMEINKEELVNSADTELLDSQIDQITDSFIEEHFLDNDEAEQLEMLVAKSMKLGELYERKKWQDKATPEGFVLVPKDQITCFWQDNDEPENFCNSPSDFDSLGDCIDLGGIMQINKHTQANIGTEKLFGTWVADAGNPLERSRSKFFVGTESECKEIVLENERIFEEAQEQSHDNSN